MNTGKTKIYSLWLIFNTKREYIGGMKKEKDIFYPENEDLYKAEEIGEKLHPYGYAIMFVSGMLMVIMTLINMLI